MVQLSRDIGIPQKLAVLIVAGLFFLACFGQAVPAQTAFSISQESTAATGRLIESNGQDIVIEFSAPDYDLEQENIEGVVYQKLVIAGTTAAMEAGWPELPVLGVLLGIPAEADYQLEIVADESQTLSDEFNLLPASVPMPLQEELAPGGTAPTVLTGLTTLSDPVSGIENYPSTPVRLGGDAWIRNQRIVRVQFYPFQYEQRTRHLIWHQKIRVKIQFTDGKAASTINSSTSVDSPFEQSLRTSLLNYETARDWRSNQGPVASVFESVLGSSQIAQNSQALATTRYRISVTKDDLYRLTYNNLKLAGVPVDPLDLSTLRLTNQGREVAYYFDDRDGNQIFGPGDSIVFYGQKFYGDWMATRYANENSTWLTYSIQLPDGSSSTWKPSMNADMLEKYTDENVYWLDFGDQAGVQMQKTSQTLSSTRPTNPLGLGTGLKNFLPTVSKNSERASYREMIHVEPSIYSRVLLFSGEDTWYWDEIQTSSVITHTYPITLTAPVAGNYTARLSGEVVAKFFNSSASPDHHIQIYLNDPQHTQPLLDASWDGKSRYSFDTAFAQSRLVAGANQIDLVVYKTSAMSNEVLDLDWLQIDYNRLYLAQDNRLEFSSPQIGAFSYRISGFTANDAGVFDITDPLLPTRITDFDYGGGLMRFRANQTAGVRYFVGSAAVLPAGQIQAYTPVDFNQPADYLFISHRDFVTALQPLVDFRISQGFTVQVIDVDKLYNQFNDGIYNPIAIKNFLAFTFQNWTTPPAYVVLVGDGHYNFKSSPRYDSPTIYMPPFLNWVDPWQGEVDSANLLTTVVGNDPLPDVAIGRMPVNSVEQLSNIISKTISYEQSASQDWKKHVLFIADNTPDPAGDFVASAEHMISGYVPAGYTSDRIYLDSFADTGTCNPPPPGDPRTCPAATQAILNYFDQQGAFLVNYIGHASLNLWTGEQIFTNQDIPLLANGAKLPIVLSMTCLDGYWMHPNQAYASQSGPSLAEELLRAQARGAVATFSPTGLGLTGGHDALQEGFYEAVFQNGAARLAEAALAAKLRLYATGYNFDLLHTFTIFGDPGLLFPSQ
jgi:hypothetical protein